MTHAARLALCASILVLASACATPAAVVTGAAPAATNPAGERAALTAYIAGPEIVPAAPGGEGANIARGVVFEDLDRDGRRGAGEPGLASVRVTNGRDVVLTDADGAYALPALDDMSLSVVQPAGFRVPTDAAWVPQISYEHKPAGTPKPLRFGGLPPTGALPAAINFPLIRDGAAASDFTCAVFGDTQVYSNQEIGFMRDSAVDDLLDRGPGAVDCILAVGDVMGDDLGLIPRTAEVIGAVGVPQWWVHGNHDFDFDADHDRDSADSWRRLWGPANYAFEMGDALFIVLDNVVYPCGAEDAVLPGREFCIEGDQKRYNARLSDDQLAFVKGLLDTTPEDRRIVFATHIPFVSFVDQTATAHQTDNIAELYALVGDRPALSLSGHTHTIENLAPGDRFEGWPAAVGVEALPFRHIVAGAVSGGWWNGDFDHHGVPMSFQRQGAPRGWVELGFAAADVRARYIGSGVGEGREMWLSINTPPFRAWFEAIADWRDAPRETRDPVPPLSINDLPDVKLLTPEDLAGGAWLTANVWMGDSDTVVTASIGGGAPIPMRRTQAAAGEGANVGAEFADPFAVQRQLTVARTAIQSRSGDPDAQGYAAGRRAPAPPAPPQPVGSLADRSVHLWRLDLPETLPEGVHVARITVTYPDGRLAEDAIAFEVRAERPEKLWRADVWNAFLDGPPVR